MFGGLPPIQSLLVPVALPELTFYRDQRDCGYTRLSVDIEETSKGRMIGPSSLAEASVYHERGTRLFVFSWNSTDLLRPPL